MKNESLSPLILGFFFVLITSCSLDWTEDNLVAGSESENAVAAEGVAPRISGVNSDSNSAFVEGDCKGFPQEGVTGYGLEEFSPDFSLVGSNGKLQNLYSYCDMVVVLMGVVAWDSALRQSAQSEISKITSGVP